jgi:hypothetical protein
MVDLKVSSKHNTILEHHVTFFGSMSAARIDYAGQIGDAGIMSVF